MSRIPRGIRNHNPGNIKDSGIPWLGIARPEERTPENQDETEFVVFKHPVYGLRALGVLLRNYSRRYKLKTPAGIIHRYAPHSENPTNNYIGFVCGHMGRALDDEIEDDTPLDLEDFRIMVAQIEAVVEFENGIDPYIWELEAGLVLGDFPLPPPKYGL